MCINGSVNTKLQRALILLSINLALVSAWGQDCPETPKWFSEGQHAIEKDPSKVALSYLRLMEECAFKAAFVLLTPEFAHASDPQAFEDSYAERKDWHTYADTVCKTAPLDNGKQKVSVKAFVANEGYFTLDKFTFELVSTGDRWRIDGLDWKTLIPDVSVPIQDVRFDVQAARKGATAESEVYCNQLRALGWLRMEGVTVARKAPPWLGNPSDDEPFGAVEGYILAVSNGDCCSALYYRTDPEEAMKGTPHPKAHDVRVYFDSSADHAVDLRDDGTATVWTKVWFSKGDTIVIQAVAFECRRVDTIWKIQGLFGGPKSYIAAGDFGDVCEEAGTGNLAG
jgi:hypothetical protein